MAIKTELVNQLNAKPVRAGRYGLYWMQAAQRAHWNHALEHAISQANRQGLPLLVLFCLVDDFPEANLRHYHFMLQGLQETQAALAEKGIKLVVSWGQPTEWVPRLAAQAAWVVTDVGHLRLQRAWRVEVARQLDCRMVEVETNCIVPVEVVSDKENFSAGTLRPRIHRQLDRYLVPLRQQGPKQSSLSLRVAGESLKSIDKLLAALKLDTSVKPVEGVTGGTRAACQRLRDFLQHKLCHFHDLRNDPSRDTSSGLSPYLHFGQISPLYIALEARKLGAGPGLEAFLEELIVRRELAHNFVHYNPYYDQYQGLAPWAQRTLNVHASDKRAVVYARDELEQARTHDPYWNAAQLELVHFGTMQGYMRMYWGKKILEWSASPAAGFDVALKLNNKYQLDGRDANGYAGVAWCFGQHDRAWSERPIFGKVRYMNDKGLQRKFDIGAYVHRIIRQVQEKGLS